MNLKSPCGKSHRHLNRRGFQALIAAATAAVAAASSAIPTGIAGRAGAIRRRAVAAEPGKRVPAFATGTVARTYAGSVAACALAPIPAVVHPDHQHIADQRRPTDRDHECRHSARHCVLRSRRPGQDLRYPCTASLPVSPNLSPPKARLFIDHSSEMWNFCRDKT